MAEKEETNKKKKYKHEYCQLSKYY